jgi:hypothetical protein
MPSSSRSSQVMDYFLLAGIRNMRRGNCDNVRCNTLCVISPPKVHMPLQPHAHRPLHHQRAAAVEQPHMVHCTMHRKANLKQVREGVLPEEDTGDRYVSHSFPPSTRILNFFSVYGMVPPAEYRTVLSRLCARSCVVEAGWRGAVQSQVKVMPTGTALCSLSVAAMFNRPSHNLNALFPSFFLFNFL